MKSVRVLFAMGLWVGCTACASADVVINEILYHAPNDLDDLQFIELHNTGAAAVNLAGWKLAKAVSFEFPAGTSIPAGGYLVVCKDAQQFKKHYGLDATGQFSGRLSHGGENLALIDAAGETVDSVKFRTRTPWPVAADGYGASLERICPTATNTGPENWAPSPTPDGPPRPGGSPGKKNSNYSAALPPTIANVSFTPAHAGPNEEVRVEADVRGTGELRTVELRYRLAGPGSEKSEQSVAMSKAEKNRYTATIPRQSAGQIIRFRVRAVDANETESTYPHPNELRPALSVFVHDKFSASNLVQGLIINVGTGEFRAAQQGGALYGSRFGGQPMPTRGRSAFIHVDPKSGTPQLFDFINVSARSGGRRIHLHKDKPLAGMTTFLLIYEPMDRYALAEHLSYEVYHRAGNAAPRTDFVRTFIDGRPIGFQLQIEQPNKAFLRHNRVRDDGNLYKVQWWGNGLVDQHKKRTHIHSGHGDLVELVAQLNKLKGDEQWAYIQKKIDVKQMATFFAVHMLVSDWDGFFNNYLVYHDVHGSGQWTMYPWDQDKTWGFHDGIRGYEVFFDMPLTTGMAGDRPPGWPKGAAVPGGFGFGAAWWRPGGYISQPLLANPQFRNEFLTRTKELLDKVYTEEIFVPVIDNLNKRLRDDVKVRAELHRQDPTQAMQHFDRNLQSLREHLTKRRNFLLAQDEIKKISKK